MDYGAYGECGHSVDVIPKVKGQLACLSVYFLHEEGSRMEGAAIRNKHERNGTRCE